MPTPLKKFAVKVLLGLLWVAKGLGRLLGAFLKAISVPFLLLWRVLLRRLAFLVYGLALRARIGAGRVLPATRRTFFAVFGHRYVVHAVMAIIVIFVSAKNIHARDLDLGQGSTQALIHDLLRIESDYAAEGTSDVAAESELNAAVSRPAVEAASGTALATLAPGGHDGPLTYDLSGVASADAVAPADDTGEDRIVIAKPTKYTVEPGDTISGIAERFGISVNTVLWANNLTARSLIRVGQELIILPVTGVTHTVRKGETLSAIAKKYGTDVDKILAANRVSSPEQIRIGETLVIPDGKPPAPPPAPARQVTPTRLGDVRDVFRPPSEAPPSRTYDGVELVWPTNQKRINQYFKWRHQGLDINGTLQDPTYAADAGIVTFAGWNKSGYGNMILIDHGNGMVTRYAHHSKLFVKAGDQVAKGQSIGMVGSTGRSTGPHLHYEIYVNGKRVNPLEYYR